MSQPHASAVAVPAAPSLRARLLAIGWVTGMVGYSVARAWVVAPSLGPYGINPWLFLTLDVGSAFPLALGQVRLVGALAARDAGKVQLWVAVVSVAFLTPYAYLVLGAGRPLPDIAYLIIAALVAFTGGATAWRVRQGARQAQEARPD